MAVKEYIEREAALSAQNKSMNLAECRKRLERIPAADVRPVVRGKWMEFSGRAFGMAEDGTMLALKLHTCSECKKSTIDAFYTNFCPNCGADMRGEQDV